MDDVPSVVVNYLTTSPPIPQRSITINRVAVQQASRVLSELSNIPAEEFPWTQAYSNPRLPNDSIANYQGEGEFVPQKRQVLEPSHSSRPPVDMRHGTRPPPGRTHHSKSNRQKRRSPGSSQPQKKCKHDPPAKRSPSSIPPEDCISRLPAGVPLPKKPSGCKVIPQTIEPISGDRSTVYFTRNGTLGMPLQYTYNLDDMDDGDEPVDLGLNPAVSLGITLVIAWPGYKEATYEILVYTPLHPNVPFVTVYGLRSITKRELAVKTLQCIHHWMIEHPWSGERYRGLPEWKLGGDDPSGVSAKLVWLSMISPVGDGRWVTQLQKAPNPVFRSTRYY